MDRECFKYRRRKNMLQNVCLTAKATWCLKHRGGGVNWAKASNNNTIRKSKVNLCVIRNKTKNVEKGKSINAINYNNVQRPQHLPNIIASAVVIFPATANLPLVCVWDVLQKKKWKVKIDWVEFIYDVIASHLMTLWVFICSITYVYLSLANESRAETQTKCAWSISTTSRCAVADNFFRCFRSFEMVFKSSNDGRKSSSELYELETRLDVIKCLSNCGGKSFLPVFSFTHRIPDDESSLARRTRGAST